MLATDPRMQDIDTDQWRNLQTLLTRSAKALRRIIVIHDDGVLRKLAHSTGAPIVDPVDAVQDPAAVARALHAANTETTDLVVVLERSAVDAYYARLQDSWRSGEDLDEWVARSFALLEDFPDGIVTCPGPARSQLGLQYRFGAPRAAVLAAVERYVPAPSTVVLAVTHAERLWGALVLGFDTHQKIDTVTTTPTGAVGTGDLRALAQQVLDVVTRTHGQVSLAVVADLQAAQRLLAEGASATALAGLVTSGAAVVPVAPPALAALLPPT